MQKSKIFKTEDDAPVGKLYEKNMKRNNFFTTLKSWKKGSGSAWIARDTDPWIRIRTKMSRIPKTDLNTTWRNMEKKQVTVRSVEGRTALPEVT